jgi:light-regulated signal transduction histidine kinase (bacteriophytochrome)
LTDSPLHVDLTNCDREPIHQLGALQPFGFLLAISSDWLVARASVNLHEFLGVDHKQALGQPVAEFIGAKAIHTMRNRLTLVRGPDVVERIFSMSLVDGGPFFDVALHLSANQIILEAEPTQDSSQATSTLSIRSMIARLDQTETMETFFREGARQARALTGFDRVMVYRFDATGAGEVVAESARSGIGSFLGLHYPASDIPVQARALYVRNLFRIIADVDSTAVAIVPERDENGTPLDLSMSMLRSVSPIHIEYLKNMGVRASLSISIVVEGKLWGLFACHHYSPRLPSFERRSTAELFGQMFASRLESRERRTALEYETRARQIADRVLTSVADDASLLDDPTWLIEALSEAIPADGIGVWINGRAALSGLTPQEDEFAAIVRALNRSAAGRVFAIDRIEEIYPEKKLDGTVAGLLAIPISRSPRDYVVLFRQEIVRSVRWAGDPHKPTEYGPNGPRLTPRKSFETWSELVRGRSQPFTPAECRVAETIRVTLIEVVLRLADEARDVRRQANERQELLIAELNHRVRNILSLINGLVRQSRSSSVTLDDYVGQLEGRVQSLARAHDQITRDNWAPASFRQLLEAEAEAYLGRSVERVELRGPDVLLDPRAFSTTALVVHELVTNSVKYGSLAGSGTVSVSWNIDIRGDLSINWLETGGPVVREPTRKGFGTTLITRSIPYDLGGKAEIGFPPTGLDAHFLIPSKYVTPAAVASTAAWTGTNKPAKTESAVDRAILAGVDVLLVEDNLIIAMDGEDILSRLGARTVVTASNVSAALDLIGTQRFDMALLDINLGEESSFPIADRLVAQKTPFLFATGYGGDIADIGVHADAPIVQKPYTIEGITAALARLNLPKQP